MSRIAVSSPVFSFVPFSEMAGKIEQHFEMWEMIVEVEQRLPDIRGELREYMASHDLKFSVHAPISDINLASINPAMVAEARKELGRAIEVAGELGIGPVSVHMGYLSPVLLFAKKDPHGIARESMLEIDRLANEHGVTLAVENMPATKWAIFTEPQEILDLIEGTGAGICFDVGHAFVSGNIDEFLEHKDLFRNVHIHDNHGKHDDHFVPGQGEAPLEDFVRKMGGYRGNWVIESNNLPDGVQGKAVLERWLGQLK